MKTVRIQFDLLRTRLVQLEELQRRAGIENRKDIFENGLTLLEWAVEEALAGNTVGVLDAASGTFQKLRFAPLSRIGSLIARPT